VPYIFRWIYTAAGVHHHRHMIECATAALLRKSTTSSNQSQSVAAKGALSIIADMNEYKITRTDVDCLSTLLELLIWLGDQSLADHLGNGEADCAICSALKAEIARRSTLASNLGLMR